MSSRASTINAKKLAIREKLLAGLPREERERLEKSFEPIADGMVEDIEARDPINHGSTDKPG